MKWKINTTTSKPTSVPSPQEEIFERMVFSSCFCLIFASITNITFRDRSAKATEKKRTETKKKEKQERRKKKEERRRKGEQTNKQTNARRRKMNVISQVSKAVELVLSKMKVNKFELASIYSTFIKARALLLFLEDQKFYQKVCALLFFSKRKKNEILLFFFCSNFTTQRVKEKKKTEKNEPK